MKWFIDFLTSSVGQKVVMSLTGLFLIVFLAVHLIGNLQLLPFMAHDPLEYPGMAFNEYTVFMTTNPLIKTVSYLLYASILIHAVQGIALWLKNRRARGGQGYAVKVTRTTGTPAVAAKGMAWLGTIIFVFIVLHLYQFWFQMKFGNVESITYASGEVRDLYSLVAAAYRDPIYVVLYVVSMVVIAMHLWHGFQSSFQTLGLNHRKYTPFIKAVGRLYSIVVPFGFAFIPVYMYFMQQ